MCGDGGPVGHAGQEGCGVERAGQGGYGRVLDLAHLVRRLPSWAAGFWAFPCACSGAPEGVNERCSGSVRRYQGHITLVAAQARRRAGGRAT